VQGVGGRTWGGVPFIPAMLHSRLPFFQSHTWIVCWLSAPHDSSLEASGEKASAITARQLWCESVCTRFKSCGCQTITLGCLPTCARPQSATPRVQ
jgi:hypothetical protein